MCIPSKSNLSTAGASFDGDSTWRRPWHLQASVIHGWRAHRDGMRALMADPEEQMLVTAGRGHVSGREAEVLRCWSIAEAAAGTLRMCCCVC